MFVKTKLDLNKCIDLIRQQAILILDSGKSVNIEVKQHKSKRNNAQNAYYWTFNTQVANCLNDAGLTYGEHELPYNSDLIHELNKHIFGVKTTTRMKVGEFCEYVEKLLAFWTEKTQGEFMVDELPESYFISRGYDIR